MNRAKSMFTYYLTSEEQSGKSVGYVFSRLSTSPVVQ